MHPLAPDFDDMTDEKLDEKIKTLNSRIVSAYRSGSQAVGQMRMLMDDYQEALMEIQRQKQIEKGIKSEMEASEKQKMILEQLKSKLS